jgi:ribosomal protein L40E
MVLSFLMSLMIIVLLLTEVILPIILILILGLVVWHLIRQKWIHRIFVKLIYRKNPLVRLFYEKVGRSVEEKGNKIVRPLAYIALILFIALISKILWPYLFHQGQTTNLFLQDGIPSMFLYIGLIFVSFGVSASIISSFLFIKETRKFKVYNRSLEIYLLSKYLENIVYVALGVALIIGTVYFWFFTLEKLSPLFCYFENQLTSLVDLTVNFEEMLTTLRELLVSFRDQFQTWCITSFLVFLASFAVPYMWFKGRRFARIFLVLFLSGTVFSSFVSFLIKKYIISELTWMYIAVWTFSALITYMVFHLINAISINKITICKHCRSENSIQLRYCGACGKKLLRPRRR